MTQTLPNIDAKKSREVCKRKSCEDALGDACFYCEYSGDRHQHDHAPIPQVAHGESIVRACTTCHTLKDRNHLEAWPALNVTRAVIELVEHGWEPGPHESWPRYWGDLSVDARLIWAKTTSTAWDQMELDGLL